MPSTARSVTRTMPGKTEFVLMIASVMMLVAFGIDSMLPALPAIGNDLGVSNPNDRPIVISAFLAGFGVTLLMIGTISDRYGRRTPMMIGLLVFAIANVVAALSQDFTQLLIARFVQGMAAACGQTVVRSVVRDRFAGRDMAQVMSLASTIFMAAPILAPALGQIVLEFGPWRWIFHALGLIGFGAWCWVALRLPETLAPENVTPISGANIISSARVVLTDRMSMGYSIAIAMMSCALYGFLLSVQQIFEIGFKRPDFLPIGFAIMASGMAAASLINAGIVQRFGMRRIGHLGLMWFTGVAVVHAAVALSGYESMVSFIALQTMMMIGFSFTVGNFGAMAMENMGRVAGMASSIQGTIGNLAGVVMGSLIGQAFDGTTAPLYIGFTLAGIAALATVFVTEGGRFFVARHELQGS
jgi:MFS transporter, DHA1 family, multidrug resistance protein